MILTIVTWNVYVLEVKYMCNDLLMCIAVVMHVWCYTTTNAVYPNTHTAAELLAGITEDVCITKK